MMKKWHNMALPIIAVAMGLSVASAGKVLGEEKGLVDALKQLLPTYTMEAQPTKIAITLGATLTPWDSKDPTEIAYPGVMVYPGVTRPTNIDEDGAEIGQVAMVAPEKLNLIAGRKYRLEIGNASNSTHYFWAPEFEAQSTKTAALTVDGGKILNRTMGAPGEEFSATETKIQPGGTAVWEFVPQVAGIYKWGCSIPSHEMSGMKGEFIVAPAITG